MFRKQVCHWPIKIAGRNLSIRNFIHQAVNHYREPIDGQRIIDKKSRLLHQNTSDQFFDEVPFESNRKPGRGIADVALEVGEIKKMLGNQ